MLPEEDGIPMRTSSSKEEVRSELIPAGRPIKTQQLTWGQRMRRIDMSINDEFV